MPSSGAVGSNSNLVGLTTGNDSQSYATGSTTSANRAGSGSSGDGSSRTNFQLFMEELLDSLSNDDLNQEKFLKSLNDVVQATKREPGVRDRKVIKLREYLKETRRHSSPFDLVDFERPVPLIIDPSVRSMGIDVERTTMFKSNLMPCKFVFKIVPDFDRPFEYSAIYKVGDDLRQEQLVLQMIALMDKVFIFIYYNLI